MSGNTPRAPRERMFQNGFGLALMMQALELSPVPAPRMKATTATCLSLFGPTSSGQRMFFNWRVAQLIERIKAIPRQPDSIPSERALRSRERVLREGMDIDRLVFLSPCARRRAVKAAL